MCCIFTCCGWMIDLIQRCWTFTMSCIISSAVCCSLLTASMSGVALGYNYSLAEYIDLKETNVSVYLKRGVFDDEIADDMDWRRSGHQPVAGHIGDNNLMTGSDDESTTLRSGRRLDDSIYESNDRNNFEGSLLRLTAKAPDFTTVSTTHVLENKVIQQYPLGSLDQLKAVQSMINMNKAEVAARRMSKENQGNRVPDYPYPFIQGRRGMNFGAPLYETRPTPDSLRKAVPDDGINNPDLWRLPKIPPESVPKDVLYVDDYRELTYPSPVTPKSYPVRPTPQIIRRTRPATTTKVIKPSRSTEPNIPKSIDEEMETYKEKLLGDKFDDTRDDEVLKKIKMGIKKTKAPKIDDYEEEIKGIPLRKKRHILNSNKKASNDVTGDIKVKITTIASKSFDSIKSASYGILHKTDVSPGNDVKNKTKYLNLERSITPKNGLSSDPNTLLRLIVSSLST